MYRRAIVAAVGLMLFVGTAVAASKDEDALFQGCDWLVRAIDREPDRDDAFGMVMASMRPKCTAMLEGIARKDNSVRPDSMRQIVKELSDLQEVIDADNGGPPPPSQGLTPGDLARQKVSTEKADKDKLASDRAAEERAAAERAAQDKAAAERAAQDKAAADKAAEDARKAAELEARRREVGDKQADAEAKRQAEREERERVAAEKKAAEAERKQAAIEERERVAAEKKAADEARKAAASEARERAAEEKRAADEAKRAAEHERKLAAMDDVERRRLAAAAERDAEAARKAEVERAEAARRAAEREVSNRRPKSTSPKGPVDGTWEQPEAKVLDRNVKRTLNLLTKGKTIQGELYEEVWFPAPSSWIDSSCGGNETFRMVTTARVSGEVDGSRVVLSREAPRILTCTCSSRCTVETRRRGMDLKIAASGAELKDSTGVFVRPGTQIVTKNNAGDVAPKNVMSQQDFVGNWETKPFKVRDQTVVRRIEIAIDADGKMIGMLVERSTQGLPLSSWSDRFCDGANKWEWVYQWQLDGKVSGRKIEARAKDGTSLMCSCPAKCTAPKDKFSFDLVYGATGVTLHLDDQVFERR